MFRIRFGAPRRALYTLAAIAAAAWPLAGCQKAGPPQTGAKLTITATQPTGTYQPGDDVQFRVTITNAGTQDVRDVLIDVALSPYLRERRLQCSPLGPSAPATGRTATCNDHIGLQSLAKGASIDIDFVASVNGDAPAAVTSQFSASVMSGPAPVSATNQASVVDLRSGSYKAFTSDGHQVDLAASFGRTDNTFTFGTGADATTLNPVFAAGGPFYDFGTQGSFMAHHDLLAGNVPLVGATPVFIAARRFVGTVAELDNQSFNAFAVVTPASGAATSLFESMAISGGTLTVCADASPHAVAACTPGGLSRYTLAVDAGVFTATDTTSGATRTFQVAQSDTALVLLRAEPTPGGRVFQVGLSTNSGVTDQQLWGADNTGAYGGNVQFVGDLVQETFAGEVRVGPLSRPVNGPAGLESSDITAARPLQVWLAQDQGLAVLMARPGSSQDGLLQVFAY